MKISKFKQKSANYQLTIGEQTIINHQPSASSFILKNINKNPSKIRLIIDQMLFFKERENVRARNMEQRERERRITQRSEMRRLE